MNEYYGQGLHIVDYFTSYHNRPTSSPNAKPRKYWLRKVQHFLKVSESLTLSPVSDSWWMDGPLPSFSPHCPSRWVLSALFISNEEGYD